jgi:hypothetical protein
MKKHNHSKRPVKTRAQRAKATPERKVDWRKQLFSDRQSGPSQRIQLRAEQITRLWGILLDLDPGLFRRDVVPAGLRDDPGRFYKQVVRPWLRRHAVLHDAEVRLSGQGLHVVLRFAEAVECTGDAERRRWAGIVKAVQAVLPTDPDAPGLTATTRARGSINSKNDAVVRQLYAGRPDVSRGCASMNLPGEWCAPRILHAQDRSRFPAGEMQLGWPIPAFEDTDGKRRECGPTP